MTLGQDDISKREQILRESEMGLLLDLASVGFNVDSIWNLNLKGSHNAVVAAVILMNHLNSEYPVEIREGIIRALRTKEIKPVVFDQMVSMYKNTVKSENRIKQALASSISDIAAAQDNSILLELIDNNSNGPSRGLFIKNIINAKNQTLNIALVKYINDPEIGAEIRYRFARKPELRRFLDLARNHESEE